MSILSSTKIGAANIPLTRKILLEKGYVKVVPEYRSAVSRSTRTSLFQSNRYKYDKKHYLTVKERDIETDEEEVHVFIDILSNLENRTGKIFSNYVIRCFELKTVADLHEVHRIWKEQNQRKKVKLINAFVNKRNSRK